MKLSSEKRTILGLIMVWFFWYSIRREDSHVDRCRPCPDWLPARLPSLQNNGSRDCTSHEPICLVHQQCDWACMISSHCCLIFGPESKKPLEAKLDLISKSSIQMMQSVKGRCSTWRDQKHGILASSFLEGGCGRPSLQMRRMPLSPTEHVCSGELGVLRSPHH